MLISHSLLPLLLVSSSSPTDTAVDFVQPAAIDFSLDPSESAAPPFTLAMAGEIETSPQDESAGDAATRHRKVQSFGAKDSAHWYLHGGWGADVAEHRNKLGLFGLGISYFIAEDVSLNGEFNGMLFNQEGDNTNGFNFNLLLRWHFLQERNWSLYLDGGAGVLITDEHVPIDGSTFNFTPQAGIGFTFNLVEDIRLMAGARWHHISNANTSDNNPGRDSIMAYAGLMFPF